MGGFSTVIPSNTNVAQSVWSYPQRSLTDIQSLVNAIQNNNPNLLSTLGDLPFLPAPMYAGQVSLTQVASFISNLVQNYRAQGVIASFINSDPYSLWHMDLVESLLQNPYLGFTNASLILNGVSGSKLAEIATSTSVPVTSLLSFISNAALSGNAAQGLLYGLAENYYYNKWLDTVTYNAPSITFSTNATLSTNVLIAQEITVASGVTVTCGKYTCFFVAQVFNNQGTVVDPNGAAGGVPVTSSIGNYGGTGGGGIVIVAVTAALGTLNMSGNAGGTAVTLPGGVGGTGGAGSAGIFYAVSGVTVPLGGAGGRAPGATDYFGSPGANGGGGGGSHYDFAGAQGGVATLNVFSSPNAMVTYVLQGLSDWWLSNVVGKPPSSATPLAYMYGSGGGAGAITDGYQAGGGGGGGAGEAVVYAFNIVSGTVDVAGGAGGGGIAAASGYYSGGGGGGGGGLAFIFYGATSSNVTANVAGGAGGVGGGGGLSGATGSTGILYIATVTVNG